MMHLHMDQERLLGGLRTAVRAAAAKATIPGLTGVLLEASPEGLALRATDLELSAFLRVSAHVTRPGAALLPAKYLYELIRRLQPGALELWMEPGATMVRLRSHETNLAIHALPEEQFPSPHRPAPGPVLSLKAHHLHTLLQETGFAASHDESRPWFTGVFLSVEGETVRAVATDGAVLACAEAPVLNPSGEQLAVILPGRSAQEVARAAGETHGARCEILPVHNQLLFRMGETEIGTRLLEGHYPEITRVLPGSYISTATVEAVRFVAAVDRALLVSRDGTVKLSGTPEGLSLSARSSEVGSLGERIPCSLRGGSFEVGLNARLLLEGLRPMGSGTLLLEFAGARSAVRFRRSEASASFFAVMPLVSF